MSQTEKNRNVAQSLLRYLMPALALGLFAFLMVAYGSAYTPPKAQKQRIVCFKFKEGTSTEAIKKHMAGFQDLKRELPEIASYSAGETFNESGSKAEYDVMHYLTFRTDAEVEKFRQSTEYQSFSKANEANWDKVLVINSEIK
jgi:multidrug efflux pump subunit AcrB